jgi:hypothetical protein
LGVIDSLGKGFQAVARHWWLILIPVLLDSFLWLGPRASVAELAQRTWQVLEVDTSQVSSQDVADLMTGLQTAVKEVIPRYNAFTMLRVGALGVPSLIVWAGAQLNSPSMYEALWISFLGLTDMPDLMVSVSDPSFLHAVVWQLRSGWGLLLASLLLSGGGIAIGSFYLASISHNLRGENDDWAFWPRVWKLGGRFLLFWVLRAALLVLLGVPMLAIFSVLSLLSPGLAVLFSTVVLGMGTWLSFYGVFFTASLVMNNSSVWRAIWNSVSVVLRNFWSTLWLFVLINLIGGGLTILWQQLTTGSWWTWIAIAGNAYVGTSLVAGSLLFYQDRYNRWQQAIAELLASRSKRVA